jgi:hypothetical protein
MPEGTKVDNMYKALRAKGFSEASAAKIAQKKTGLALATGKPPVEKECMAEQYCKYCGQPTKNLPGATVVSYEEQA